MAKAAEEWQAKYYERTVSAYDEMHNSDGEHEHNRALRYIDSLSNVFGLASFVDVGAGTGRGVSFFHRRGKQVAGVEPVAAMIEKAEADGLPRGLIRQGSGYELPFSKDSFDAVFECGVLHHVADPARVVSEMARVAKRAVFLSDSNRFGQGRYSARLLKLALYKSGLWSTARRIQTGGKMYTISEGDGLAYSYSVYDSYRQLAAMAEQIWLIPTCQDQQTTWSWAHPLLTSSHVLLCAFKHRS